MDSKPINYVSIDITEGQVPTVPLKTSRSLDLLGNPKVLERFLSGAKFIKSIIGIRLIKGTIYKQVAASVICSPERMHIAGIHCGRATGIGKDRNVAGI